MIIFETFFSIWKFGTVTEWVMICVTAMTAYFLYKTLKSQQDVQKTQNELFKIENLRFKESIKPILKYTGSLDIFKTDSEKNKILTIEVKNTTNSIALNISRIVIQTEPKNQVFIITGLSDKCDHLSKEDNPLLFHFQIDTGSFLSGSFVFALTYDDIAGTKYKQGVYCICDNQGIEINPFLPEIIYPQVK
jgi:hypothetical protein